MKFLLGLRNLLIPRDTLTPMAVGSYTLLARRDHGLRRYLAKHPDYGGNIARLAKLIEQKSSNMTMVDIGANIGDTVALVKSQADIKIVCLEGSADYFKVLQKNLAQFKNVASYQALLSDRDYQAPANIESAHGSAKINQTADAPKTSFISFDSFVKKLDQTLAENIRLIKIDTDGFDTKIIRGAKDFIANHKPVLFFEFDRAMLADQNEDGLKTLADLKAVGYRTIVFYDNVGRFILATDLANQSEISQLYHYTYRKAGAFPFYDIAIFHQNDQSLADEFVAAEITHQHESSF